MSSTTTTWSTDTNTKSGSATTYTDTVSSLKLVGAEGGDAILRLFADEGDDNADQWRIVSQASTNKLNFMSFASGAWSTVLDLYGAGGAVVINEDSADIDFRVESNGNANMLFVDGGTDRIGIGEAVPQDTLEVNGTIMVKDALKFTQDDGNEYIDSLTDEYMDYGATTAHRFLANVKLTADSRKLLFGAGDDASIYYDGSHMIINPKEVGSGNLRILGDATKLDFGATANDYTIEWDGSDAVHTVTAGDFVFTGGNVGIGTIDPDEILEIAKGMTGNAGSKTGQPFLRITQSADQTSYNIGDIHSGIQFYTEETSGDFPQIQAFIHTVTTRANGQADADVGLSFGTTGDAAAVAEKMVITHAGDVGIGTATPAAKMHIVSSANTIAWTLGYGMHRHSFDQDIRFADSSDQTVIVEASTSLFIAAGALITLVSAVVKTVTNLGTHKVNITGSSYNGTAADTGVQGTATELLGEGATGTQSTDSASATDIDLTQAKEVWVTNTINRGGVGADQYIYVLNAVSGGSDNGTTNSTAGTLSIAIEYFGID